MKTNDLIYLAIQNIKTAATKTGVVVDDKTTANLLAEVIEESKTEEVTVKSLSERIFSGFKFAAVIEGIRTRRQVDRTIPNGEQTDLVAKRPVGRPRKVVEAVTTEAVKRPVGRPKKVLTASAGVEMATPQLVKRSVGRPRIHPIVEQPKKVVNGK